jgi:hypothetical protein
LPVERREDALPWRFFVPLAALIAVTTFGTAAYVLLEGFSLRAVPHHGDDLDRRLRRHRAEDAGRQASHGHADLCVILDSNPGLRDALERSDADHSRSQEPSRRRRLPRGRR